MLWGHRQGAEVQQHSSLTLERDGSKQPTSCPRCITPGKEPWYPLSGRLGGPQSWSGQCGEQKICCSCWDAFICGSVCSLVAIPTTLTWIPKSLETVTKCTACFIIYSALSFQIFCFSKPWPWNWHTCFIVHNALNTKLYCLINNESKKTKNQHCCLRSQFPTLMKLIASITNICTY